MHSTPLLPSVSHQGDCIQEGRGWGGRQMPHNFICIIPWNSPYNHVIAVLDKVRLVKMNKERSSEDSHLSKVKQVVSIQSQVAYKVESFRLKLTLSLSQTHFPGCLQSPSSSTQVPPWTIKGSILPLRRVLSLSSNYPFHSRTFQWNLQLPRNNLLRVLSTKYFFGAPAHLFDSDSSCSWHHCYPDAPQPLTSVLRHGSKFSTKMPWSDELLGPASSSELQMFLLRILKWDSEFSHFQKISFSLSTVVNLCNPQFLICQRDIFFFSFFFFFFWSKGY